MTRAQQYAAARRRVLAALHAAKAGLGYVGPDGQPATANAITGAAGATRRIVDRALAELIAAGIVTHDDRPTPRYVLIGEPDPAMVGAYMLAQSWRVRRVTHETQ